MIDFTSWRDLEGKWNNEPDLLELEEKGCHMVVFRNPEFGNLNGYVGVNINSPLFSISYGSLDVYVHGGLTFAGKIGFSSVFKKNYWYFGFDTAHAYDLIPSMVAFRSQIPSLFDKTGIFDNLCSKETYRDLNYVSDQVNALHNQLQAIADSKPKYRVNHKKMYRKLHKLK